MLLKCLLAPTNVTIPQVKHYLVANGESFHYICSSLVFEIDRIERCCLNVSLLLQM
jgi:hypothetical protein